MKNYQPRSDTSFVPMKWYLCAFCGTAGSDNKVTVVCIGLTVSNAPGLKGVMEHV